MTGHIPTSIRTYRIQTTYITSLTRQAYLRSTLPVHVPHMLPRNYYYILHLLIQRYLSNHNRGIST